MTQAQASLGDWRALYKVSVSTRKTYSIHKDSDSKECITTTITVTTTTTIAAAADAAAAAVTPFSR